jgi:hypothetical protein
MRTFFARVAGVLPVDDNLLLSPSTALSGSYPVSCRDQPVEEV